MDIVLLRDVERLGAQGAVVSVKPGFARNYLIPCGLAAAATTQQLKLAHEATRQRTQKVQRLKEQAEGLKRTLEQQSVTLTLSLGEGEKAFGSVTAHDITEALARAGHVVEKHAVHLEQPIKALGIYEVPVRVHADVTATVKVHVVKA